MADYLPRADRAFDEWMIVFANFAAAHIEEMGFTADDLADVQAARAAWESSLSSHAQAQAAAEAMRVAKDAARTDLTRKLRPLVGRMQASQQVTNEQRVSMGLQLPNGHYHRPAGPPTTPPLGRVSRMEPYLHIIAFLNDGQQGTSKAKPRGVAGCEVWYSLEGDTVDVTHLRFAGTATRTPYAVRHAEDEVGRMAYYRLRWVNSRSMPGPWSPAFSAMILG